MSLYKYNPELFPRWRVSSPTFEAEQLGNGDWHLTRNDGAESVISKAEFERCFVPVSS